MQTKEKVEIVRLASGPQKPVSEYKRFAILVLGSFGCICCSFSYAWNLVSDTMQDRYKLSQRDMSTIVTVGLVVQYCVLPYAFLFDFLGPLPIAILATIYFPLGTLLMALCFQDKIAGGTLRLSVFNALMSTGCCLFDLSCCITVLSYFPANRGPVTALLKTYTGLGSALVACMKTGYFRQHTDRYFFFLFGISIVVGGLCIAFLRLPSYHLTQWEERRLPEEEKERRLKTKAQYLRQQAPLLRFVWGFVILFILIAFLPTQGALTAYLKLGYTTPTLIFAIIATILTFLYLIVALPLPFMNTSYIPFFHPVHDEDVYAANDFDRQKKLRDSDGNAPDSERMAADEMGEEDPTGKKYNEGALEPLDDESEPIEDEAEIDYIAPAYPGSFIHNLRTLELWALWWTMFTVVGAEFVVIYNASNILSALQGKTVDRSLAALLTVLNGVGSAVGRLLMSYFEVWSQKRKAEDRIPITVSLFLPTGSIIITVILFLVLPSAALPLPYVVAALGNGFLAGVTLLVTRTIFARDPAKHYNFCFTATMLASLVFNRFLYGEWYTVQGEKQATYAVAKRCFGKKCVLMPLVVLMCLACTAFITDVILHFRYRSFCQRTLELRAKLREEAREEARRARNAQNPVNDGIEQSYDDEEALTQKVA